MRRPRASAVRARSRAVVSRQSSTPTPAIEALRSASSRPLALEPMRRSPGRRAWNGPPRSLTLSLGPVWELEGPSTI
eukprot:4986716-Alexandrium_andersonii.AAC.1